MDVNIRDVSIETDVSLSGADIDTMIELGEGYPVTEVPIHIEGLTFGHEPEQDPTVPACVKGITPADIDKWNDFDSITNIEIREICR